MPDLLTTAHSHYLQSILALNEGQMCSYPELGALHLFHVIVRVSNSCLSAGCPMVSSLNLGRRGESHPLAYLDMSECSSLDDTGLQMVVLSCPNLSHLYLRKCVNISGKNITITPLT